MRTAIDVFGVLLLIGGTVAFVFGLALCVVKDTPPDGAQ